MKKYLDIDESNIVSRTRAYFRLHGKDIPVLQDGDRSIVHVEKSVRWAFRFIFNLNKKKSQSPQDQQDNNTIPIAPQDHDEYIPQDMQDEDREDPNKPPSFWQISPPLEWYHYSGRKSYYDIGSKLWSKKKILSDYHRVMDWSIDTTRSRHTFTGNIRPGTYSIPLPIGSIIDTSTLEPSDSQLHLREDQNGCIYVSSDVACNLRFDFFVDQVIPQKPPIPTDHERIITGSLTDTTIKLLSDLQGSALSVQEKAEKVCAHINLGKKYSVEYQFYIYNTSRSDNYFENLDASPVLECYSANTLYTALMRELWVPSRLCTGHMIDSSSIYNNQSHISNKTGHAWSEIWNGSEWIRMDATPREKDKHFVDDLKEEIERAKEARKSEMSDMGFDPGTEEWIYKTYKDLEEEVQPFITRNIRDLDEILPREYKMEEEWYFRSGKVDSRKLVQWKISGDTKIFTRNALHELDPNLLLFEGIVIDKSGSMGNINTVWSPLREAVKSAIIRAKTLEYFDVQFSILIFHTDVDEVMSFGEKFTSKKNTIPARIMRSVSDSGGTDISKPLEMMQDRITEFETHGGKWRYGNITFIGDGEPTGGKTGKDLTKLIERINKRFPITAYYISGWSQNSWALDGYFWSENVEVISDVSELSSAMMRTFNRKLRQKINQITSYDS